MKVVAINGSSREKGNTYIVLRKVLEQLEKEGIETEIISLAGKTIKPCRACFTCGGKENCSFNDDEFTKIYGKMKEADGIILGSPVYTADVSSNIKAIMDRAEVIGDMNSKKHLFKHKVGAAVVACRRGGALNAIDALNHFFLNQEMFVVGSTYWNMVYGMMPGDVEKDEEGIANMINLGQNMAYILKKLKEDK